MIPREVKRKLIVSDMHHRISGVSASIRALLPSLVEEFDLLFVANSPQGDISNSSLLQATKLLRHWSEEYDPIWHVRRNNEMLWGLLFRTILNKRLKLVFTSAAIRRHSIYPRWLISKMDAVIATSERASSFIPNVAAVVPHGVDIQKFTTTDSSSVFPWSRFECVIGIVGRIRPEKGTDIFASAISKVLARNKDSCAVIVGKTTTKYRLFLDDLKTQWREAGVSERVFITDEIEFDQMPSIYETFDIVCAPARYEGFGLVPAEAMVSGTAVVATRTGAYEEMVIPGKNGELVDCGNRNDFELALLKLSSSPDLIASYKEAGKEIVRNNFSLASELNGIVSVYDKLRAVN